jgi:hypothetical protein
MQQRFNSRVAIWIATPPFIRVEGLQACADGGDL